MGSFESLPEDAQLHDSRLETWARLPVQPQGPAAPTPTPSHRRGAPAFGVSVTSRGLTLCPDLLQVCSLARFLVLVNHTSLKFPDSVSLLVPPALGTSPTPPCPRLAALMTCWGASSLATSSLPSCPLPSKTSKARAQIYFYFAYIGSRTLSKENRKEK